MELTPNGEGAGFICYERDCFAFSCFDHFLNVIGVNGCDSLTHFIINGKPVLNAEYQQSYIDNPVARQAVCDASKGAQFSTLILAKDLDDSRRFSCF